MTVYWVGTELEAFKLANAPSAIEHTSGTFFDSTYSRASTFLNSSDNSEYLENIDIGSDLTDIWVHFRHRVNSDPSNNNKLLQLVNSSGQPVFRLITATGGTAIQASYWDGSSFQNIGSAVGFDWPNAKNWDVHLVCGASSLMEVALNGSSILSEPINDADVDDVRTVRFHNIVTVGSPNNSSHYSECIIADVPTVGWRLFTVPPTGNGANTDWTGDFNDVDEVPTSDADFVSGAANGDIETFTGAASTLTGFEVKAVVISARVKRDSGGPQNLQMALRESSTDYASSTVDALSLSFDARQAIFEVDPATSAIWTTSDAGSAGLEFGVKAIT